MEEPVVITGIGMVTAVGWNCETAWRAICRGRTRVRPVRGLPPLPDGVIWGATVDFPGRLRGVDKILAMARQATREALRDAGLTIPGTGKPHRCGCAFNAHMGYLDWYYRNQERDSPSSVAEPVPWFRKWLPQSTCVEIARLFHLHGPRLAYSTACASSLIGLIAAVRYIQSGQADVMVAGGSDVIDPLFAASFYRMGVLARIDPNLQYPVCRPFDEERNGFVLGEGAATLVLERLDHALRRKAPIYAVWLGSAVVNDAHHVTDLDQDSHVLLRLIEQLLTSTGVAATDIDYVNAHGTGTWQNDRLEMSVYGKVLTPQNPQLVVSSTKSVLGHLVNASGAVETAVTVLALRDGFLPPTMHVRRVDPSCPFDCLPRRGIHRNAEIALKVSLAFGGHLAAVLLRRWNGSANPLAVGSARAA